MTRTSGTDLNKTSSKSKIFFALLLFYGALVLWFTVFSRPVGSHTPQLELFWSYKKWLAGNWALGREILGNIGMFIPFGFLLTASIPFRKKTGVKVLLAGIAFSCAIEVLQFVLWRGLFEFDDILNNAAGAVLGYCLYMALQRWVPNKYAAASVSFLGILFVLSGAVVFLAHSDVSREAQPNFPRSVCFQLDNVKWDNGILRLSGFAFLYNEPATHVAFVLRSTQTGKEIQPVVEYGLPRPDVNRYFQSVANDSKNDFSSAVTFWQTSSVPHDYAGTGFSASVRNADPEEEYEIIMKINPFVTLPAGVYVTGTDIHYAKQQDFILQDVAGTDLEEIVNKGYLRVYRPDRACYVYQYKGSLYWIADKEFAFEEDGTTYMQYHLWTTQIDKLPQKRLKNKWYWDNIGGYFEKYEITGRINCGRYRVSKRKLPTEYAITSIVTGYYKNGKWIWKEFFRPVYEFGG